ncbi:hypothetical protein OROGR_013335 [Orobanche gracilis]
MFPYIDKAIIILFLAGIKYALPVNESTGEKHGGVAAP